MKRCLLTLNFKLYDDRSEERIGLDPSCARKETVEIDLLVTLGNVTEKSYKISQ